jgi:hypothetical protein
MYPKAPEKELTPERREQLAEILNDFQKLVSKANRVRLPILFDLRVVEDPNTEYSNEFYIYLLTHKKLMRALAWLSIETVFNIQYKELLHDFEENRLYSQDL